MSRKEALNLSKRIKVENNNIVGSISLTGAIIDDITLKNYTTELKSNENVILLSPRTYDNGYYVETGWASTNKNIELPNISSEWKIKNNSVLTPNTPVTLEWINKQGIVFIKTFLKLLDGL